MDLEQKLSRSITAIQQILESLSPDDIFHFLVYNTRTSVILSNKQIRDEMDLEKAKRAVQVSAEGGTDIYTAMSKAISILEGNKKKLMNSEDKYLYTRKIFLFTDGVTNSGVSDPQMFYKLADSVFLNHYIQICTFGIGTDFNEELMKGIAAKGRGDYFYLTPETIKEIISQTFVEHISIFGVDCRLILTPVNGTDVSQICGHDKYRSAKGNYGIFLGPLKQNSYRQVLLDLSLKLPQSHSLISTLEQPGV
eukprot:TRINITY_DN13302_c0_g1_i1.p1 TRINITY_DN13302_c0_g1~~TRINITY_DN13302_c0_g1_i1.p1  ORF type:complete len:251 (-),score=69.28 TRINITY_DN13302_c0_g1_i1:125-877(-)